MFFFDRFDDSHFHLLLDAQFTVFLDFLNKFHYIFLFVVLHHKLNVGLCLIYVEIYATINDFL